MVDNVEMDRLVVDFVTQLGFNDEAVAAEFERGVRALIAAVTTSQPVDVAVPSEGTKPKRKYDL
jgi:hypothetical protein